MFISTIEYCLLLWQETHADNDTGNVWYDDINFQEHVYEVQSTNYGFLPNFYFWRIIRPCLHFSLKFPSK